MAARPAAIQMTPRTPATMRGTVVSGRFMGRGSRVSQSEAEKFGLRDLRMAVIWGTCLPEEQMRRLLLSLALGLTAAAPLHAQGLRDIVSDLFIFGDGCLL